MSWGTKSRAAVLSAALVIVAAAFASPALGADGCEEVDVTVDEDSCGRIVSVSVTGDAEGQECSFTVNCVTVSGTGNASNRGGDASCGGSLGAPEAGCVAISGTGNASNEAGAFSCGLTWNLPTAGCVAISGTGDASNDAGRESCGAGDVFGTGSQPSAGCIAVSGTGNASNEAGAFSCGWGRPAAAGCLAVSGTGDASNEAGAGACAGSGLALASVGCVAVTGTGDASNEAGIGSCGATSPVSQGCIAVSGTGHASGDGTTASGCETGEEAGTGAACQRSPVTRAGGGLVETDTLLDTHLPAIGG